MITAADRERYEKDSREGVCSGHPEWIGPCLFHNPEGVDYHGHGWGNGGERYTTRRSLFELQKRANTLLREDRRRRSRDALGRAEPAQKWSLSR
jgi:hypothetical protein